MPRTPIVEFSEYDWNHGSDEALQGTRQQKRASFTFRYKCAKLLFESLRASLYD